MALPQSITGRRLVAVGGATAYVLVMVAVQVVLFSIIGVLIPTALMALGCVAIARYSRYPLLPVLAVPLLAWGGLDVVKVCPSSVSGPVLAAGPESALSAALGWRVTGPVLGVTAQPDPHADLCPYVIELVPLAAAYLFLLVGTSEPQTGV